jgi:hypothetical protein
MKRLRVLAVTLLTLIGVFVVTVVTATASSASVCQPNGTGCTKAGTYSRPNTIINSNFSGVKVTWTRSVVQPYSSGIPLYWTAYMTYTNITSASITLSCPGSWANASYVSEHMSGGSGDDGTVSAQSTSCSQDPGLMVPVASGGTYTVSATFHNVPWPGSGVAITWGNAGTSSSVYPFQPGSSPSACPSSSLYQEPQNVFSGYSACAKGNGLLTVAEASWTVPKVSCPLLVNYPRAAVWVGLWGSMPSISNSTAWLPQIGTDSQCNRDSSQLPVPGTYYFAVWEMRALTNGQGNTPQPITSMTIHPGDRMVASVEYEGADGNSVQHFSLALFDVTVNDKKPGSDEVTIDTATTEPVRDLSTILQQGGAVVEGSTSQKTKLGNVWANGLAQFTPPVSFTQVQVGSVLTGPQNPAGVNYIEWVYKDQSGKGHLMASNSKLSGSMYSGLASYTVTWKRTT